MLLLLDALLQARFIVVVKDRHGALHQDRPGIDASVDEMDRTARDTRAVVESLACAVHPRKRRQKRGVHVYDPPLVSL